MPTALKAFLEIKGVGLAELARRSGVSTSYLSLIVNGQRTNVRAGTLAVLARACDISIDELTQLVRTPYERYLAASPRQWSSGNNELLFRRLLAMMLDALDVNDLPRIESLYQEILGLPAQTQPPHGQFLQWYEAWQLTLRNQFDDAIPKFLAARSFTPRFIVDKRFIARASGSLGGAYVAKGEYRLAAEAFRASLRLWKNGKQAGWVYLNLGTMYRRTGQVRRARIAYARAVALGAKHIQLAALSGLAQLCFDVGDPASAKPYLVKGYLLAKELEAPRGKGDLYCNLGKYYAFCGKPQRAVANFCKAIDYAALAGNLRIKLYAMVELADTYLSLQAIPKFAELVQQIEGEIGPGSDALLIGLRFNVLAKKHLSEGQLERSLLLLETGYRILGRLPASPELLDCCRLLRKVHLARRDPYVANFFRQEVKRLTLAIKSR